MEPADALSTLTHDLANVVLCKLVKARAAGHVSFLHAYYDPTQRDGNGGTVVVIMDDSSNATEPDSVEVIKSIGLEAMSVTLEIVPAVPDLCYKGTIPVPKISDDLIKRIRFLAALVTADNRRLGFVAPDFWAVARYKEEGLAELQVGLTVVDNLDVQAQVALAAELATQNRDVLDFVINGRPIRVEPDETAATIAARCPVIPEPILPEVMRMIAGALAATAFELLVWQPGNDLPALFRLVEKGPEESGYDLEVILRYSLGVQPDPPAVEDGGTP